MTKYQKETQRYLEETYLAKEACLVKFHNTPKWNIIKRRCLRIVLENLMRRIEGHKHDLEFPGHYCVTCSSYESSTKTCHNRPPTPDFDEADSGAFPVVNELDWCRQYTYDWGWHKNIKPKGNSQND